jgi:hypothetical protein
MALAAALFQHYLAMDPFLFLKLRF